MKTVVEVLVLDIKSYSESSLWICFFSKEFGLQNGIIKGGKKKKTKAQVLGLYYFTLYKPKPENLQTIVELELSSSITEIYSSPPKTLIAFFLADCFRSVIPDSRPEEDLFEFAKEEVLGLNRAKVAASFPVLFLTRLITNLGYTPLKSEIERLKDTKLHSYSQTKEAGHSSFSVETINTAYRLFQNESCQGFSLENQKEVFDLLDAYCLIHIPGYESNKSISVIREVLYN